MIMKTFERSFISLLITLAGGHSFAQKSPESVRIDSDTAYKVVEPQKLSAQKDLRAKRGTDLRLSLMPQKTNGSAGAASGAGAKANAKPADSFDKSQGGLANVSDISGGDTLPEHHLSTQERQEMRLLLRQQRLKPQN